MISHLIKTCSEESRVLRRGSEDSPRVPRSFTSGQKTNGCGSKFNRRGYAGFGPCLHLPGSTSVGPVLRGAGYLASG